MSGGDLGNQFGGHFFNLLDAKNYQGLSQLFRQNSIVSFEGNNVQGMQKIIGLFQAFNKKYPKTKHQCTADTLPTPDGSNLVFLTGKRLDHQHSRIDTAVLISATVVLKKTDGKFWISNLIYRGEASGQNIPSNDMKVGAQFVGQFYKIYDSDHKKLGGIYTPKTVMKYETDKLQGAQMIMCKLTKGASDHIETQKRTKLGFRSVTFNSVKHEVKTLDIHPGAGGLLIQTSGFLAADGSTQGVKFGECFVLMKGQSGWKVLCQVFRQIY
uniref:NTF2 domain-containing protein n=1 Tax=Lotharella globosa TaxID=91324 RepID=A0A6U3AVB9_9EUKA|mmetsp:Transcript_32320/g.62413  ORF Transcript_32320/g.62413 Transcript_32320/m.62413 type:complete len:269 (+) Transcript_32320:63-869(+)